MYGNKSLPTRLWSYGAGPPVEGADLVDTQMELGRRYRNTHVRVERKRRERVKAALWTLSPALAKIEAAIATAEVSLQEARDAISQTNVLARKKVFPAGAIEATAAAHRELKRLRKESKALRQELFASPTWKPIGAKINGRANAQGKKLYAAVGRMGLGWGTRIFIGTTVKRSGPPPQFSRRDGGGHLAVQLQPRGGKGKGKNRVTGKSLMAGDAFAGTNTILRIGPVPPEAWEKEDLASRRYEIMRFIKIEGHYQLLQVEGEPILGLQEAKARVAALGLRYGLRRTNGKHLQRTTVSLRIGSSGRDPIFATIPVVLHRPMPWDAQIKWVHLIRRRIATHCEWSVQFALSRAIGWNKLDRAANGVVSIDVGWRITGDDGKTLRPDGSMRVAYWKGSDGAEGEVTLPARWLAGMRKTEDIQSIRDKQCFNPMRDRLAEWLRKATVVPAWLRERTATLYQWKSQARLAGLVLRWRDNRFDGDGEIFEALEAWRKRDKHLLEYQGNLRDQLQRRRMDIYRNFAADMRRKYHTGKIEKLNLRDFHKLAKAEEASVDGALKKHVRDACLSDLFQCIKESMTKTVKVPAKNTTAKCYVCGSIQTWNHKILRHTCTACGAEWDQDANAAENIGACGENAGPPPVDEKPKPEVPLSQDKTEDPKQKAAPEMKEKPEKEEPPASGSAA